MPLADRPPSPLPPAASALFVNRVEESRAVRDSVAAIRTTLRDDTLDPDSVRNVLVFYGIGGVGKTRLSVRIEKWLRGEVADAEWGVPPTEWLEPYEDVRARWLAVADTMIRASMLGDGH